MNMKQLQYVLLFVLLTQITGACEPANSQKELRTSNPTETLIDPTALQAIQSLPQVASAYTHQVMVLGSFHFNRVTDGSDVVAKNSIDITSSASQGEIEEMAVKIVEKFKPTIIAVEWMPERQDRLDSLYQAFQKGNWTLARNESFQIGFRIAQKMKLAGVFCVDNRPPQPESINALDDIKTYAQSLGQEQALHEYSEENTRFNTFMDEQLARLSLRQYVHLINSPAHTQRYKALSLTGLVNLGYADSYAGADLTGNWYRRNTRIFVNIRNLCKTKEERVLVIYGAAHKWVLDELFEGSPEFELVQPLDII